MYISEYFTKRPRTNYTRKLDPIHKEKNFFGFNIPIYLTKICFIVNNIHA